VFEDWTLAHKCKNNRAATGKNFQIGDSTPQIRTENGKANPRAEHCGVSQHLGTDSTLEVGGRTKEEQGVKEQEK
jgi:hypothetical protein